MLEKNSLKRYHNKTAWQNNILRPVDNSRNKGRYETSDIRNSSYLNMPALIVNAVPSTSGTQVTYANA